MDDDLDRMVEQLARAMGQDVPSDWTWPQLRTVGDVALLFAVSRTPGK